MGPSCLRLLKAIQLIKPRRKEATLIPKPLCERCVRTFAILLGMLHISLVSLLVIF